MNVIIIAREDFLLAGKHIAAGTVFHASAADASLLIGLGRASRFVEPPPAVIETADARPAVEIAAKKPAKSKAKI